MGEAVEQEVGYAMTIRAIRALIALLLPPACREEVLGDLQERYATSGGFCIDAMRTVPHVIASRIRRTADPQLLLMHAIALYLCYYAAGWFMDRALLRETWGLARPAIPALLVLLVLLLEDAYSKPGPRSRLQLARGPLIAFGFVFLAQSLPSRIVLVGSALSLPLTLALRLLFSPQSTSRQGPV
jgi:hypothetical protein